MDLFSYNKERQLKIKAPLAERMRPKSLEDYVGQRHLIKEGMPLFRLIKSDRIQSMIFYGPPGTGKTSLAMVIANSTNMKFSKISAVTSGIADIREVIKKAEENLSHFSLRTILFIDEIHRFNKSQQDALLPYVENGTLILIGATTENPYFEVNKALLSRCQIMELHPIDKEDLSNLLDRALTSSEGFKNLNIDISNEAKSYLINASGGDARYMLNGLEIAVLSTDPTGDKIIIGMEELVNSIQKKFGIYDKNGDNHYDTISAFIKSIRGSDPDSAILYLAIMLNSGEDIKFIARRLVVLASEDIGLADPNALTIATSCMQAINFVGMPEARIILAEAVIYLATAAKSNTSYLAIDEALNFVKNEEIGSIPLHLRDSHYQGSRELGVVGYKYPHDYPGAFVLQNYWPNGINKESFYKPKSLGYEKNIKSRLEDMYENHKKAQEDDKRD